MFGPDGNDCTAVSSIIIIRRGPRYSVNNVHSSLVSLNNDLADRQFPNTLLWKHKATQTNYLMFCTISTMLDELVSVIKIYILL